MAIYNLKRPDAGHVWRAKLRRDMFDWFYSDLVPILDYDKRGRDETEDQEDDGAADEHGGSVAKPPVNLKRGLPGVGG